MDKIFLETDVKNIQLMYDFIILNESVE